MYVVVGWLGGGRGEVEGVPGQLHPCIIETKHTIIHDGLPKDICISMHSILNGGEGIIETNVNICLFLFKNAYM